MGCRGRTGFPRSGACGPERRALARGPAGRDTAAHQGPQAVPAALTARGRGRAGAPRPREAPPRVSQAPCGAPGETPGEGEGARPTFASGPAPGPAPSGPGTLRRRPVPRLTPLRCLLEATNNARVSKGFSAPHEPPARGLPRDHLPAGAGARLRPGEGHRPGPRRQGRDRLGRPAQAGRRSASWTTSAASTSPSPRRASEAGPPGVHAPPPAHALLRGGAARCRPAAAGEQACAMEHSLTDEAMDRMVRFFEFLGSLSHAVSETLPPVPAGRARATHGRDARAPGRVRARLRRSREAEQMSLADLKPGQSGCHPGRRRRRAAPAAARHGDPARDRRSTSSARALAATRSGSAARARGWPCAAARRNASGSAGAAMPRLPVRSPGPAVADAVSRHDTAAALAADAPRRSASASPSPAIPTAARPRSSTRSPARASTSPTTPASP